jgi:hypothetical protein
LEAIAEPPEAIQWAAKEGAMDLYLDTRETELLMGLLNRYLEGLRREIYHTDRAAFKKELKADEALMQGILGKLKTPMAMGI